MSAPFPLRDFLLRLDAEGIRVRVRDYRRIALALQGSGPWTRRRLRDTLAVLLTKSEHQQNLLFRRFDHYFSGSPARVEAVAEELDTQAFLNDLRDLEAAPDKPPEPPPPPSTTTPPELPDRPDSRSRSQLAWLLLILAMSLGLAIWPRLPDQEVDLAPPRQMAEEPPSVPEDEPKTQTAKTRTYKKVPYVKDIQNVLVGVPDPTWKKVAWAAGALLLLLIAYLVYLRFNRKIRFPKPLEWDEDKPRRFSLAQVGGEPSPLLDRDTLDEAADAVGYFYSDRPAATLDVPATIRTTLDQGGLPALRFHRRKHIRTLLILRDRHARASWNRTAEELAEGIQQRGVPVVLGAFKGSPARFKTEHGGVQHLEDLEETRDAFIILIFSDASRIRSSHAWADLKQWPRCAWLDYREPRLWSSEHPARRYGLPLHTADAQGIRAVLKRFLSEQGASTQAPDVVAPPVRGELTGATLAFRLGDALSWAQDCSVLQPISRGLADKLRRHFYPHLAATRLERILDLPGTRQDAEGIRFSFLARRLLKQGFVARPEARRREVLEFLRDELDQAGKDLQEGSLARLDWQSRCALLDLELGRPTPELADLARTPALNAALSNRLQEFGLSNETGGIPLANQPPPETLQSLAWLPDSPLQGQRRHHYPLRTGQRRVVGLISMALLAMITWGLWLAVQPVPNWGVEGVDVPALLLEQPREDVGEVADGIRGMVFDLPTEIRLEPDMEYRLRLFGGGYWQERTFRVPEGQEARLIVAEKEIERPCVEEITAGLQAIVCLQDGTVPPRSWRERLQATAVPDKPTDRRLSIGIEISQTGEPAQGHWSGYDRLLAAGSLDAIFRLYPSAGTAVLDRMPTLLEQLSPSVTQALWWLEDSSAIPLSEPDRSALNKALGRFARTGALKWDRSALVQLLRPGSPSYISENELIAALRLDPDGSSGAGDPLLLFRPLSPEPGSGEHRLTINATPPGAQIRVMNIESEYRPGMKLEGGEYGIEVSAPNYETWREWVTLDEDTVLEVALIDQELKEKYAKWKKLWAVEAHPMAIVGPQGVAFAPDGHSVLSGSWDNTLKLWDLSNGKEIRTFSGHSGGVFSVAFSPDGRRVLSGSVDNTLKLWDLSSGKEIRTFSGHSDIVFSVAFAPDGRSVLSGSWDNTLKLWDLSSGKEIRTFRGHFNTVFSVAFAPNKLSVLLGSSDETLRLWDVSSGGEIRTLKGHSSSVLSVAFSPDGRRAMSGDNAGTLILWGAE